MCMYQEAQCHIPEDHSHCNLCGNDEWNMWQKMWSICGNSLSAHSFLLSLELYLSLSVYLFILFIYFIFRQIFTDMEVVIVKGSREVPSTITQLFCTSYFLSMYHFSLSQFFGLPRKYQIGKKRNAYLNGCFTHNKKSFKFPHMVLKICCRRFSNLLTLKKCNIIFEN
jgi:hypothetical protein